MRGARLDPGSALCAVRDDIKSKERAVRAGDDWPARRCALSGMTQEKERAVRDGGKNQGARPG